MLKNSQITVSELIIRFLQFETKFNKSDNLSVKEDPKYNENAKDRSEIPILKNFEKKYSHYSTVRFSNNYWFGQKFKFDQKTKKEKYFEISSKESENQENTHCVDISQKKMKCSCSYTNQWGIPCSHMLCVKIFLQSDDIEDLPVDERWERKTGNSNLNEIRKNELILFLTEKITKENNRGKI